MLDVSNPIIKKLWSIPPKIHNYEFLREENRNIILGGQPLSLSPQRLEI